MWTAWEGQMSWNIKSIGPRAGVRAAVEAQSHMPAGLKAAIFEILDEPPVSPDNKNNLDCARVESFGHAGGGYGSIGKLEVELFRGAELPAAPPAQ